MTCRCEGAQTQLPTTMCHQTTSHAAETVLCSRDDHTSATMTAGLPHERESESSLCSEGPRSKPRGLAGCEMLQLKCALHTRRLSLRSHDANSCGDDLNCRGFSQNSAKTCPCPCLRGPSARSPAGLRDLGLAEPSRSFLVHGWDRIKNVRFDSLLGLSIHKNVNCYPTMPKV